MTALVILAYAMCSALALCILLIAAYGLVLTWAALAGLWEWWRAERGRALLAALA